MIKREVNKNLKPAQQSAKAKADAIIQEIQTKKIKEPLVIDAATKIMDLDKTIKAAAADLDRYEILSPTWRAVYTRIYKIREALKNETK